MKRTIIYLVFVTFLFSCSSDDLISELPDEINLPKLQTNEVTDITFYSVKTGGRLIDTGDSDIIEVGLVISLTTLPTTESNINKFVLIPDNLGDFNITIKGIPANTTFFIRAYGINSEGIGYGNEVQFTSLEDNVYKGDITLSTQEEVNEFGANKYTTINGSMAIQGTVTDLSPLESIVFINYDFEVRNTQSLRNLEGLNNIKITGKLGPSYFLIENNSALESLSGLNNLEITSGYTGIINNDKLINMQGLNSYSAASFGSFIIRECDGLQSLSGLENLQFIGDTFFLIGNSLLSDISSLSNLSFIARRIHIEDNSNLQNIDGFEAITSLEKLYLINNDNLTNLDGLINISTISSIKISYNDNLNDLSVFQNINTVRYLFIEGNNSLINLVGFSNLTSIEVELNIYHNSSLSSLNGIENLNSINTLKILYNPSLTNLNGLNGLTKTTGNSYDLAIKIGYNSRLNSLTGLDNLIEVEGYITIFSNSMLNDFCALKNLFANDGHNGRLFFTDNMNNPSTEEIINNCN